METLSLEERFENIEHNIRTIKEKIVSAAKEAGRNPDEIKLMAVTKTVEPVFINYAIDCGIDLIGENKVQELCAKQEATNYDMEWRLIGHLQRNKVRQVVGAVSLIHSVGSLELLEEIYGV